MKRMTKLEAMARIHALNVNLPPHTEDERHLVHYLEQMIIALEPLKDNDPVDEVASKLLFEWTDLFTYQANDDQNLAGLPALMLAMGAHLFHHEVTGHKNTLPIGRSTITKLPKLPSASVDAANPKEGTPLQTMNTSYFFRAFLIPYFDQNEDVRFFKECAETDNPREIYHYLTGDNPNLKKLIKNLKRHKANNNPLMIVERLAHRSRKETLLSHVLKLADKDSAGTIILTKTGAYKNIFDPYIVLSSASAYYITRQSLEQLMNDYDASPVKRSMPYQPTRLNGRPELTDEENALFLDYMTTLIENNARDKLDYLLALGAPTTALSQALRKATAAALVATEPDTRTQRIETIKEMISLGAGISINTIKEVADHLRQPSNPYPDDIFQALFSCSLLDITSLKSLRKMSDTATTLLLTSALFNDKTAQPHPTKRALQAYYRKHLETTPNITPFLAAIYCASQTKSHARFFGLTQATFERLLLTEMNEPLKFIPVFFKAINDYLTDIQTITDFKDALVTAISALSPETKLKLQTMMGTKKFCLATLLLGTRQHKGTQKKTTHLKELKKRLILSSFDYETYDSSDEEAIEAPEDDFEPSHEQTTAIRIFKDLTPVIRKPIEFYLHLLNDRLGLASAIVRQSLFNVNEPVEWIQRNINGVTLNNGSGTVLLKLWSDAHPPVPTTQENKIKLTYFLVKHGLSLFSLLEAYQALKVIDESAAKTLWELIETLQKTNLLEQHFYKTPDENVARACARDSLLAEHKNYLSRLLTGEQSSPIMALLFAHLSFNGRTNPVMWSPFNENNIKQHFMQHLTKEQKLGLAHLLKILGNLPGTQLLNLQNMLISHIEDLPDLIDHFKALKDSKTSCALFMILKYQPTDWRPTFHENKTIPISPYNASPYTLFKQKQWPKPVPEALRKKEEKEHASAQYFRGAPPFNYA